VAGAALLLMASSATADHPAQQAAQAAPIPAAAPAATVHELLARRAAPPPASRRIAARTTAAQRAAVRAARVRAVITFARRQIGDPYRWGAAGPHRWDCSGLTLRAYARAGIHLPRRARDQSARGRSVARRYARAGDLVLWGGVGRSYHVGIYVGRGHVLHSPRRGQRVRVAKLWGRTQFRRLPRLA
jgi:cell wall-associated NlpC family hydrolase